MMGQVILAGDFYAVGHGFFPKIYHFLTQVNVSDPGGP